MKTDISESKSLCLHCHYLNDASEDRCKRCNSNISQRKKNSFTLTLAFAISSLIFLVPANLLPMMIVTTLGVDDASTIMEGVLYFLNHGSIGIGIVIFIASIAVPVFKLSVIFYLLILTKINGKKNLKLAMKLYRTIELIGKWSMLDIFVVALMVSMVQFKTLATIVTGPAAIAFALAVVLTIIATQSFDSRLLWDEGIDESK